MSIARFVVPLLLSLCSLGAVACGGARAQLATPPGFAELPHADGPFAYRAANAHGVVIGTRVEKNEPRGNLDFWADAVSEKLAADGYKLEKKRDVRSDANLPGKMTLWSRDIEGREVKYLLTVYTTDDQVYLVEAAGDAVRFDPLEPGLETTALHLRRN